MEKRLPDDLQRANRAVRYSCLRLGNGTLCTSFTAVAAIKAIYGCANHVTLGFVYLKQGGREFRGLLTGNAITEFFLSIMSRVPLQWQTP